MTPENQDARRQQIEDAAYRVLDAKGFKGLSMLAVAREANASNETLYRWYGDKTGLFRALIERNADLVSAELERAAAGTRSMERLDMLARRLLTMLTGDRAVALNRAAAADATGTLGATLAISGRDRVFPILAALLEEARREDALDGAGPDMVETFISLLVGDWQIRRTTGAMAAPDPVQISDRAQHAIVQLWRLFPGSDLDAAHALAYLRSATGDAR